MSRSPAAGPAWGARRIARLSLLVLLLWITERLATHTWASTPLDLVNLAFHEAGHVFLRPFGNTLHFLGGTLFQLGVPALLVWYFLYRRRAPISAGAGRWGGGGWVV